MKTAAILILLALLTACGGEDSPPDEGVMPVTCAASAACG